MGKEHKFDLKIVDINPFSPRETEIANGIIEGKTNKEIAEELGIAYQTVKNNITGDLPFRLGLFGKVELLKGERPPDRNSFIRALLGDVLFLREPKK